MIQSYSKKCILLMAITLLSSSMASGKTEITSTHRQCQEDSDCVIIGRGGCCARDSAVNKKFKTELSLPTEKRCHSIKMRCLPVKAVCREQQCQLERQSPSN